MKKISLLCLSAIALSLQTLPATAADGDTSKSWMPYMSGGYVGINLGSPRFDDKNCAGGFSCDDPDLGGKIYTGGMFNRNFGLELAYVDMDALERNGGESEAHGFDLSIVGSLPLNNTWNAFARLGTTYGRTKTSGAVGSTGEESGWEPSYGFGVGVNINPRTEVLLEWDRHRFEFVDREADVDLVSLGLKYRF